TPGDPQNSIPDFREDFNYQFGNTGGRARVTLNTKHMPTHNHGFNFDNNPELNSGVKLRINQGEQDALTTAAAAGTNTRVFALAGFSRTVSLQSVGGSESHENLPPF